MTQSPAQQRDDIQTPDTPAVPASATGELEAEQGFAALGLGPATLRAIADLGYGAPTPIQEQAITPMLTGRDVIAQAPTGTGKTAAYGLPIVERLDENELAPQALIVVPTRELAIQVAEALHAFGKYREMVTLPIYGGQPYERQLRALARGVQVVVGTPGRLLDHLRRQTLVLARVRMAVLDEVDEMLDMGFIEDIEAILAELPSERQSALFSATIPPRIAHLAQQYLRDPVRLSVAAREAIAPRVRQVYYEVPGPSKPEALARILDLEEPESAIVFVRTRRDADEVAERLNGMGYLAQATHGDINQAQRERTLERFRAGHTQLLVATDVAARGLDIPDVSHIINYDLPLDADAYVHRIGRTGRAGRGGEALTLVTPREHHQLHAIEQAIHRRLERLRLPTPADVAARRRAQFREEVLEIMDAGQLDPYLALVEDLAGGRDPAELAAAAFKLAAQARESRRRGGAASVDWLTAGPTTEAPAEPAPAAAPDERPESASRQRGRAGALGTPGRGPRGHVRADQSMARIFLRVGRRDGVRPADIVGAIANEAGIVGDAIGDIDIYDTFAFVEVPEDAAEQVRAALNRTTIRGRAPRATPARPGDEWAAADDEGRGPGREEWHGSTRSRTPAPRARPWEYEREQERRPLRGPRAPARGSAGRTLGPRPSNRATGSARRPGPGNRR